MANIKIFLSVLGLGIIAVIATFIIQTSKANSELPGKYDTFATCLKDKGAEFYGAFWCPHCKTQKKLFGSSVKLLPYIECSTPDGKNQTQICIDKKIEGYPTWIFKDGSKLSGEIPLADLAAKTMCELPK